MLAFVILLINGPFGIGKTSLANALLDRLPQFILFDPELCGYLLREVLGPIDPKEDFQLYPAWADLVVETTRCLIRDYSRPLQLPMTVYLPEVSSRLLNGLAGVAPLVHVVLYAPPETIYERLLARGDAREGWAWQRVVPALHAQATMAASRLDARPTVSDLADAVTKKIKNDRSFSCE